ncbi:MAG: tetratricopeptide repeat protein, partial [Gemmatimonadota bacterium]|nr:tetratricopeptide repeat protein [Gemmatimonadota bacterium]
EAAREFRHVAELKEEDAAAHFYLGLVAIKKDDWESGEESFRRADELDPKPVIKSNLGLCLEQLGKLEEAESAYGDSVSKARQDVTVLTNWGVVALRLQKYEVAEGRLDRAREVAGEKPLPEIWYWARAMVEAVVERYDNAIALLQDGLAKHPMSGVLRNNLAVLFEVKGDIGKAEETLREADGEALELPQLAKNLGDVLYRAGRHDEAWDAYQQAIKLDPDLGDDTYFKLGNIAYKRMDQPTATTMWNKTLELNPEHQLAKTNLDTMSALQ